MKFRRKRSFRRVHARTASGRRTKRLRSYGVSRGGIRL